MFNKVQPRSKTKNTSVIRAANLSKFATYESPNNLSGGEYYWPELEYIRFIGFEVYLVRFAPRAELFFQFYNAVKKMPRVIYTKFPVKLTVSVL